MRVLAFAAPLLLIAGQGQAVTTASVTAEARYEVRSVSGEPFVVQTIIDVFEPLLERTTGDGRASATFDIGPPPVVPPFVTSLETTLEANSGANGTAVAASFLEDDEFFVQNTTPG